MTDHSEILLRKMTRREFRQRMRSGQLQAVILPVAAIEQHLEHLAMEQDWRSACLVAERVAENLRPHVLVAEALMVGISEHHMSHPGTLSLRPGTFMAVVEDVLDCLTRAGFTNLLVLNGHGGNVRPIEGMWEQVLRRFKTNVQFLSYWDVLTKEDAKVLKSGAFPGHAQEFETSTALAAFPENVRTDMWTDQPDSTPALATAEVGQQMLDRAIERVTTFVQEMIDGRRVAETPPFFP